MSGFGSDVHRLARALRRRDAALMKRKPADGKPITDLQGVLERIDGAYGDADDRVTLEMIRDAFGARTFSPLLLLAGVVTVAPVIGDIPGVPTVMAALVLSVAIQMLLLREHLWLPQWLLKRSVRADRLDKALKVMRKPARWVDKLLRPRLVFLTRGYGRIFIALTCILIALATPPMEFIPLTANGAGAALTAFGLALVAHDGVFALAAYVVTFFTLGGIAWAIFF